MIVAKCQWYTVFVDHIIDTYCFLWDWMTFFSENMYFIQMHSQNSPFILPKGYQQWSLQVVVATQNLSGVAPSSHTLQHIMSNAPFSK